MFDADKTRMIGYRMAKKIGQYVKPFSSSTGTLRTDRQPDRRTEFLYQYRASVCWRAIKTVSMTIDQSEWVQLAVTNVWRSF